MTSKMTSEADMTSQFKTLTTDATPLPASELPENLENSSTDEIIRAPESVENEASSEDETSERDIGISNEDEADQSEKQIDENVVNRTLVQDTKNVNKPISSSRDVAKKKKSTNDKLLPKSRNTPDDSMLTSSGPASVVYNISDANSVHVGPVVTVNMAATTGKSSQMAAPKKTRDINALLQSTLQVTDDDIDTVSPHVGHGWRKLGRQLKFTGGQLDQFEANFSMEGRREVIYQMLLDWKRTETDNATRGILCKALWSAEQYDPVRILARKSRAS